MPFIISAEAAVQSKRPGYVSIFDPKAKDIPGGLKPFYADPPLIKRAAERLKADGFIINHIGKITISIMGTRALFERVFNVKLQATERGITVKESSRFGYIDTNKSSYNDVLSGVAIAPRATLNGIPEDPPSAGDLEPGQIQPSDLPRVLNFDPEKSGLAKDKPIRLAFIDAGYISHPYIEKHHETWSKNITLINEESLKLQAPYQQLRMRYIQLYEKYLNLSMELNNEALSKDQMPEEIKEGFNELADSLYDDIEYNWNFDTNILMVETLKEINDYLEMVDTFLNPIETLLTQKDSPHYHGTSAVIVALEMLKEFSGNIDVYKIHFDSSIDSKEYLQTNYDTILQNKPDVLSCSYSLNMYDSETEFEEDTIYVFRERCFREIAKKSVIVFAAGNYNKETPNHISIEAQWDFVLSVGGAFIDVTRPSPERTTVTYSNETHGYTSEVFPNGVVPDICGFNGPRDKKLVVLPYSANKWAPKSGTSYCAPQIAVACAFIKQVWPDAQLQDIRDVLIASSDPITNGESAQRKTKSDLLLSFLSMDEEGNTAQQTKPPGLLNFNKALKEAERRRYLRVSSLYRQSEAN